MSTETSLNEWLNPQAADIRRNKKNQSGLAVLKRMMTGSPKQKARIDQSEAHLRAATADLERMAKGLKPKGREAQLKELGANPPTEPAKATGEQRPRMSRQEATRQYLASFTQTPDPAAPARKPNEPVISDPARPHTESSRGIPVRTGEQKSHWLKPIPDDIIDELTRITGQDDSAEHENLKKLKVLVPLPREAEPWYPKHSMRIESVTIDTDPEKLRATRTDSGSDWVEDDEAPIPTSRVIGENERDEVRVLIAGGPESNNQNAIWRTLENVLDRSRATNLHLIVAAGAKPIFSDQSKQGDDRAKQSNVTPIAYAGQGPGYLASRWVHYKGPDANVSFEKYRNNWELPSSDGERDASGREVREDRNLRMLKHGKPHLVIIFPQEGEDHTTSHLAEIATMRGIPVEIGTDNGRTYPFNDLQSDGYTPPARDDDDSSAGENDEPARRPDEDHPAPQTPTNLSDLLAMAPTPRAELAPVRGKGRPTGGAPPAPAAADNRAHDTGGRS